MDLLTIIAVVLTVCVGVAALAALVAVAICIVQRFRRPVLPPPTAAATRKATTRAVP